jgi:membrane protein YqaA with SNARE-associated domain
MNENKIKKYTPLLPLVVVAILSGILYFIGGTDIIIDYVGIENAYFLMFIFAALGGLTTFNTVPYYSLLFLLATAGLHPFYLGLSSALGVMCGDSFSYYLGKQGGQFLPNSFQNFFNKMKDLAEKYPKTFPAVCLLYGSISPLSNDLVTIPGGMAKIPYLKIIIPLAIGNIIFNVTLAYLIVHANTFITSVFKF